VVFDLAAQVSYIDSAEDPFLDLDINCGWRLNVLEACFRNNPCDKITILSSRFVYGAIKYCQVNEKHPFNSLGIYGMHKL